MATSPWPGEPSQAQGKPPAVIRRIIAGRLKKYSPIVRLLDQPFVKLPEKSVKDFINEKIAKIGANASSAGFGGNQ